ncbi:polysaccharide export protein [Aquimarina sp. AD10]|uniref:Sugar transporter n=1 Tax=Aquimarina aggregata TaxID=1642818 RepID=A0A162DL90_9FLAO|nr:MULTISPECIES: polysaccharide biosynthesis/export family protein [Aquimarina]AXT59912.1 polysaccharide export protein [Aquimarina sp. AD10]KZS42098.1 sugar transporter [Aquimarina aggregata]RKN00170.1 polysaccharide export protein [Aquimarina sp. AD10]
MLSRFLLFFVLLISFFSCKTPTDVVYFQNAENLEKIKSSNSFTPIFQVDDIVSIFISATDMDAARPFNLMQGASIATPTGEAGASAGSGAIPEPTYLIDEDGNIDFPVLGTLKISGLTRIELKEMIKEKLKIYIKDPIVSVRLKNFKFTVLGEVSSPGTYSIPNERVTLIEALGMAGDMTIRGKRNNVMIIRESDGVNTYNRVDLTSKSIFESPVYYLAQNDVLYVEPNKARVKESVQRNNILGVVISVVGLALSIVTFATR